MPFGVLLTEGHIFYPENNFEKKCKSSSAYTLKNLGCVKAALEHDVFAAICAKLPHTVIRFVFKPAETSADRRAASAYRQGKIAVLAESDKSVFSAGFPNGFAVLTQFKFRVSQWKPFPCGCHSVCQMSQTRDGS
jgi:hypothetical protein